jgi:hypothetical protein
MFMPALSRDGVKTLDTFLRPADIYIPNYADILNHKAFGVADYVETRIRLFPSHNTTS